MNTPPEDAICIEPDCARPAQAERWLGVDEVGNVIVEWVCDGHQRIEGDE